MSSTELPKAASASWGSVRFDGKVRSIDDQALGRHVVARSDPGGAANRAAPSRGKEERLGEAILATELLAKDRRGAGFAHAVQVLHLDCDRRLVRKAYETEQDMVVEIRGLCDAGRAMKARGVRAPRQLCAYDRRALCLYFRHLGETGEELVQAQAPLADRVRCLRDACAQLRAVNAEGLGHYDVKPSNLTYDRAARQGCLIDFGSLRRFEAVADWANLDDSFRYTERYFPRHKVREGQYVTVRAAFADAFGLALTALDMLWPHVGATAAEEGSALSAAHHFVRRLRTRASARRAVAAGAPGRAACLNAVCALLLRPERVVGGGARRFRSECGRSGEGGADTLNPALLVLSPGVPDGKTRATHDPAADDPTSAWDAAIAAFDSALREMEADRT